MTRRIGVAALVGTLAPQAVGLARADHDMAMSEHHHGDSEISVGLAVQAASYENRTYVGSYQGVAPSLGWMRGAFGASATIPLYHLTENGLSVYGPGDAMITGHAAVYERDALQAGVALHAMFPTGSERDNLGMGHAMVTPGLWSAYRAARWAFAATAGYTRALTTLGAGHDHGPRPLVDPMNMQELTWSAGAGVDVGGGVRIGGRAHGGVPIGTGITRLIGAGRVAWSGERLTTGLELQVGLAGDPFTMRGVLDTALRF
jgi:hypothetical protein